MEMKMSPENTKRVTQIISEINDYTEGVNTLNQAIGSAEQELSNIMTAESDNSEEE